MAKNTIAFPRFMRRSTPERDGETELQVQLEVYKMLAPLTYSQQTRILEHCAHICEENHRFHDCSERDDMGREVA